MDRAKFMEIFLQVTLETTLAFEGACWPMIALPGWNQLCSCNAPQATIIEILTIGVHELGATNGASGASSVSVEHYVGRIGRRGAAF